MALGFEPVGTYRRIGWQHGRWHDVAWMQRILADAADPPAEPRQWPSWEVVRSTSTLVA